MYSRFRINTGAQYQLEEAAIMNRDDDLFILEERKQNRYASTSQRFVIDAPSAVSTVRRASKNINVNSVEPACVLMWNIMPIGRK